MQWVVVHCEAGVACSVDSSDNDMRDADVLAGTPRLLFETGRRLSCNRVVIHSLNKSGPWKLPCRDLADFFMRTNHICRTHQPSRSWQTPRTGHDAATWDVARKNSRNSTGWRGSGRVLKPRCISVCAVAPLEEEP